jgi:hypothetical protein
MYEESIEYSSWFETPSFILLALCWDLPLCPWLLWGAASSVTKKTLVHIIDYTLQSLVAEAEGGTAGLGGGTAGLASPARQNQNQHRQELT